MAWNNKGVALADLGRYEEAVRSYDEAVAIDPIIADAWYNKGVALVDLGNMKRPLRALIKL